MSIFKTVFSVRSTTYAAPAAEPALPASVGRAGKSGEFDWLNRLYFRKRSFGDPVLFQRRFAGMVDFVVSSCEIS